MKFYIASAFTNHVDVTFVGACLRTDGHHVTYDWTPVARAVLAEGADVPLSTYGALGIAEIEGVRAADAVVVILPGGPGTHAELGAALALGRPVLLFGPKQKPLEPVFYSHPGVRRWAFDAGDDAESIHAEVHRWVDGVERRGA